MADLNPPFVASDHGDVSIFESIDAMVALIEPIDALDGGHEFFDAYGAVLEPIPVDGRWRPMPSSAEPQIERLDRILRAYFARLPDRFETYATRAASSRSLSDLIALRLELAREPRLRPGFRYRRRRQ